MKGDGDDGLGDAAILQDAAEAAAGADEERDGGGGGEAVVAEAEDVLAGEAPQGAEGEEAGETPMSRAMSSLPMSLSALLRPLPGVARVSAQPPMSNMYMHLYFVQLRIAISKFVISLRI